APRSGFVRRKARSTWCGARSIAARLRQDDRFTGHTRCTRRPVGEITSGDLTSAWSPSRREPLDRASMNEQNSNPSDPTSSDDTYEQGPGSDGVVESAEGAPSVGAASDSAEMSTRDDWQ